MKDLPFIELELLHAVDVLDEGSERFRVGLEEVEEGHDTDGLEAGPEDGPVVAKQHLLLLVDLPHLRKLKNVYL